MYDDIEDEWEDEYWEDERNSIAEEEYWENYDEEPIGETLYISDLNNIPYANKIAMVFTELDNYKGRYITLVLDDKLKVSISLSDMLTAIAEQVKILNN